MVHQSCQIDSYRYQGVRRYEHFRSRCGSRSRTGAEAAVNGNKVTGTVSTTRLVQAEWGSDPLVIIASAVKSSAIGDSLVQKRWA